MSSALDVSLKVLYVQSLAADSDQLAVDQLREASPELQITTIAGSAAALAELRRTPGWQALFASSALPQNEVLALIASLRRDRIPIAIVPILDDARQDLFASAVATGADDVLVRRAGKLVNIGETLVRIRQSPHLFPAEQRRRISVLYAGRDPLVWNLLDQVPFAKADRATIGVDGTCSVRRPGSGDDSMRVDAVIIDESPGDAHPLQVLKSVKAQASDLPVIMLTSAGGADIATAALELGADDTVLKAGIFRRRLIATLRRVHQRLELSAQQQETKTREERLRQIVENVPTGIMVIAGDGQVLAMNASALQLFGATKPREVVGRDFRDLVADADRHAFSDVLQQVTRGEAGGLTFTGVSLGGGRIDVRLDAVVLERDARGSRGVVASVSRIGGATLTSDAAAASELANLRDAVQTLERHHSELEDARAHERSSWNSERQQLEARLEEAERLAAERRVLQERLDEVTDELARTSQSFVAERQALERRLEELEQAVRAAAADGASRADLERELYAVREEQRGATAAHALERSGWEDIRTELETRVQQLDANQPDQEAAVSGLREELQTLEQTLVEERSRWTADRDRLEAELRDAREALWSEHTERDASRATFEAELDALNNTLSTERTAWNDLRARLEGDLSEAQAAVETISADRDRLRRDLEQQQHTQAALEAERAAWHDQRASLEQQAADSRGRAESAEADRDAVRQDLELQLEDLRSTVDAERADWQRARQALEQDVANACAAADAGSAERTQAIARFEQQIQALQAELDGARRDGQEAKRAVDGELADARAAVERAEAERDRTREELERQRATFDDERRHLRGLEDRARELEAEHHQLSAALDSARRRAADAEALADTRAAELDAARTAFEEQRHSLRTELDHVRGELESELARLRDEHHGLRSTIDGLATERDQLGLQLAGATADLERLRAAEHDDWQPRLATLEAALSAATDDANRRQDEWSNERARLQQEIIDTRRLADQERGHLVSLHARETDEWRRAVDQARTERDHAVNRLAAVEADLRGAQDQLAQLDQIRATLDAALADLQTAQRRTAELETRLDEAAAVALERQQLLDALEAARNEIHETDAAHHAERRAWTDRQEALDAQRRDLENTLTREREAWQVERLAAVEASEKADRLTREQQVLTATMASLQEENAALSAALAESRAERDREHQALDAARSDLADANRRAGDGVSQADRLAQDIARREARERTLEAEVNRLSARLIAAAAETDAIRGRLEAGRATAAAAEARLLASEAFGYALTSMSGELVNCNDTFAHLLGYADAADARRQTTGRPFPGLANRPDIAARLASTGHVDRVISCLDRVDGQSLRVIESATLLTNHEDAGRSVVEHILIAGPAGPTADELLQRRLREVGSLTAAMVPELESLSSTLASRSAALARADQAGQLSTTEARDLQTTSDRLSALLAQLAAFSRRQMTSPESLDLADVVRDNEALLARLAGDYIQFSFDLTPADAVEARRNDLDQLVTSLITLGRDLLPVGGSEQVQVRQIVDGDLAGPVLAVVVKGYGTQIPAAAPSLELIAERCGGTLQVTGDAGQTVQIAVHFPRCGRAGGTPRR